MALLPPDPVFTLTHREIGPVNSLCFHQNERLFAATQKGQIYLFDLQTNRSTFNMTIGENPLLAIRHSDDFLFSLEKGGTLKQNQLTNSGYKMTQELQQEHAGFCGFDCDPEAKVMVAPKHDNAISVFALDTLKEKHSLAVPAADNKIGIVACVKYLNLRGQPHVLAGYNCGAVQLWDLRTNQVLSREQFGDSVTSLDYDLVTNRGMVGSASDKIELFSFGHGSANISKKADLHIKNAGVNCVKIRKDLKVFVSGGFDGRIRVFSWKTLRPLAVLSEHKANLMDVVFSDGPVSFWKSKIMAASGADGKITLWDIYN